MYCSPIRRQQIISNGYKCGIILIFIISSTYKIYVHVNKPITGVQIIIKDNSRTLISIYVFLISIDINHNKDKVFWHIQFQ